MEPWFTIDQIDSDTYVISEYKHWEETHCYLLNGNKESLLIDTGLGVSNIREVVESLTRLPIRVANTHVHWDHIGGHKYFQNIAVHEMEKDWISTKFPIPLPVVKKNLMKEPCEFPDGFDEKQYEIYQGEPTTILHDNEIIPLGDRDLTVIHTPGHSPGHVCFYEKARNYLYSGDLIYEGTLDAFYPSTDPKEFMLSIDKVKKLKLERVLPGHHNLKISPELIEEIDQGFTELYHSGKLEQGNGVFYFKNFKIHI